ncbi:MAG: hypothetical protein ACODAG_12755, partial [Myxococcota bacterium]
MPYDQGYHLGRWFRQRHVPGRRFDVEAFLVGLGVAIRKEALGCRDVDAVCAWGRSHGPVIIVNLDGKHAQGDMGQRATLA